jgi:hypothetical protein
MDRTGKELGCKYGRSACRFTHFDTTSAVKRSQALAATGKLFYSKDLQAKYTAAVNGYQKWHAE